MATEQRQYTVERADRYLTTLQLHRYNLVIPGPTTMPDWDTSSDLSAVDTPLGMRIVEGHPPDPVAGVEYRRREGRRQIAVDSDVMHTCLDVEQYDDVAIYDDGRGLLVVEADPDPVLAAQKRGEWP